MKVRKNQPVKIRSMQRLTTSIEATTALKEVTSLMKPVGVTYQAAMQVKVLSPEILDIIEADVFQRTEGSMKDGVMVSHHSLYRGRRPWHGMKWMLRELGRSSVFLRGYIGTRRQGRELIEDTEEVGLADSTRSLGKPSTWGSGQRCRDWLRTYRVNT